MIMNYMDATKIDRDLCSLIAMEECSELTKEISKAKRGKLVPANMAEEIADVLISIDWIKKIYCIDDDMVNSFREAKERRVAIRLSTGDFR